MASRSRGLQRVEKASDELLETEPPSRCAGRDTQTRLGILRFMPNIHSPQWQVERAGFRRARLGEQAGSEHLGLSLFELAAGAETDPHYHVANEELLIVLSGRPRLRSADGWQTLQEGDVVAFPRGDRGLHALRNETDSSILFLVASEMNGPDICIDPDAQLAVVLCHPSRAQRRLTARFPLTSDAS